MRVRGIESRQGQIVKTGKGGFENRYLGVVLSLLNLSALHQYRVEGETGNETGGLSSNPCEKVRTLPSLV